MISSTFFPWDNASLTYLGYHSANILFMKDLQWSFIVRSKGWSRCVMLFGTLINQILLVQSIEKASSVIGPQKTPMIKIVAWSGFFNSWRYCFTKRRTISSITFNDSALLLKCFGFALRENDSGNLNRGRDCLVLPP